jgi:hypothetical protein
MNSIIERQQTILRAWTVVLFIVHCFFFMSTAQGKVTVGLRGGLQLAHMSFNADALSSSNRVGFFAGPTLRITTPILGMGIDVSGFYDQSQLKADGHTLTAHSVVVPAHLRFGINLFKNVGVFAFAGPQLRFNVGDDVERWTDAGTDKMFLLQTTTLGANLGAGVLIGKLEASLIYHIPLGKTADFTWNDLRQQLKGETWNHAKSSVDSWRLSVAYYF